MPGPTVTAGLSQSSWPQRTNKTIGYTPVSRSAAPPPPFAIRTEHGQRVLVEHPESERLSPDQLAPPEPRWQLPLQRTPGTRKAGPLMLPQVERINASHHKATAAATQDVASAAARAYDSAKAVATPSDWRLRCNRKAEDFVKFRETQRRNTIEHYRTSKPELVESGRYYYGRLGLGDPKAGLSTDSFKDEERLDDAWLRDRRETAHELAQASAHERRTVSARVHQQEEVNRAITQEHDASRRAAAAVQEEQEAFCESAHRAGDVATAEAVTEDESIRYEIAAAEAMRAEVFYNSHHVLPPPYGVRPLGPNPVLDVYRPHFY